MNIIAEYTIRTPILPTVLEAVPEMEVRNTALYPDSGDRGKILIWAWGDDFDAFDDALGDHDLVREYDCLAQTGDRRLYAIVHIADLKDGLPYPLLFENNGVVLDATATRDGFDMRVRFPSRESLRRYRAGCKERGIPFRLQTLSEADGAMGDGASGVTDTQREALVCALELGYFDIPRQVTMDEVADELAISTQAVSTRLRRGQQNLVRSL
ncbi:bacterio-opsin activator HTH domain-containing protein [Natrialba hulunbeirensis JCM 10989]|uniref:Bacterio-opsin activator HTH domain-containing protein n=1 Tax=Natrialba hulunbeirensis JCM 10989 TaxID=1227493 RepID=M0A0N0_9EURY|nr:helix-turn-helix domain-containing protein [Natrialba hulunbeirensis]ELY92310.1 bacterio-opsin activator HTH domain-containing protein [Natrialba hulunbeirensis JCM 10989]